jgi:hypothetical protein
MDGTRSQKIKLGIRRARRAGKEIGANGHRLAIRHKEEALERAQRLYPIVVEFRSSGRGYREMVKILNERGEPTPSGVGVWHVRTLQRLVARARQVEKRLRIVDEQTGEQEPSAGDES